jgi:hypothetical protein
MNDDQHHKRDNGHETDQTTEGTCNLESGNQDSGNEDPRSWRGDLRFMDDGGRRNEEVDGHSAPGSLQEISDAEILDLDSDPVALKAHVVEAVVTRAMRHYSGPLPPASEMAEYESVLQGSADRILRMTEKSVDAKTKATLADAGVTSAIEDGMRDDSRRASRQQIFSFFIITAAFIAGCVFTLFDKQIPAIFSAVVFVVSGMVSYRFGRQKEKYQSISDDKASE